MKKRFLVYLVFLISLVLIFGYRFYSETLHYSASEEGGQVFVTVPEGSSAQDVGKILSIKGLIKSPAVFQFYVKQQGLAGDLKAGSFVLEQTSNMKEIVQTLVEGKSKQMAVTLLEGWTAQQMADYLQSVGLTDAVSFMECVKSCEFDFEFLDGSLEGFLYPDTYFVDPAAYSDEAFIGRLLRTFALKLSEEDFAAAQTRGMQNIIIMASIVEREERNEAEQAKVAGILWKRYDNGIGLGADATVLYALGRTKGGLTYQDLQVDSPYNTRKYRGLPPTAIANPGISSIRASLYPEKSPYLYYLHGSDGQIHYGATLDEHNINKAKYL